MQHVFATPDPGGAITIAWIDAYAFKQTSLQQLLLHANQQGLRCMQHAAY
jgi:hypothetical protein